MDIVGIGVVATFFSMLGVSIFGVQSQKPPVTSVSTECPNSAALAQLTCTWDSTKQRLAVESCDAHDFTHGDCGQKCLLSLRHTQPAIAPSTVIG